MVVLLLLSIQELNRSRFYLGCEQPRVYNPACSANSKIAVLSQLLCGLLAQVSLHFIGCAEHFKNPLEKDSPSFAKTYSLSKEKKTVG